MTVDCSPWLPESALIDTRTLEPVAKCLAGWSDAWLSGAALSAPPRWEKSGPGEGSAAHGFTKVREGSGHTLWLRTDGELELASALLGRELGPRDLRSEADRLVVQQVIDGALDALESGIEKVLPAADGGEGEGFFLPIDCAESLPLFRLEAERAVLVAMAKKWAGAPREKATLAPLRSSIERQPVHLSALVGASRLPLADLDSLGIGDVLTLDVPVGGLLGACIDQRPSADAALALNPSEDQLTLQIERPAAQW